MEDVIKKIINIEEKARAIIEAANQEKEIKEQEFDQKLSSLEEKIMGDARKKIKQLRERELNENTEAKRVSEQKCQKKIAIIEERVVKNKDQWVSELVENVLKR